MYTKYLPRDPNVLSVFLYFQQFFKTRCLKIANGPNDLKVALTTKGQKYLYTLNTYPKPQSFVHFLVRLHLIWDIVLLKSVQEQNDLSMIFNT